MIEAWSPQLSHQAKRHDANYQVTRLREPQIMWTLAPPSVFEQKLLSALVSRHGLEGSGFLEKHRGNALLRVEYWDWARLVWKTARFMFNNFWWCIL